MKRHFISSVLVVFWVLTVIMPSAYAVNDNQMFDPKQTNELFDGLVNGATGREELKDIEYDNATLWAIDGWSRAWLITSLFSDLKDNDAQMYNQFASTATRFYVALIPPMFDDKYSYYILAIDEKDALNFTYTPGSSACGYGVIPDITQQNIDNLSLLAVKVWEVTETDFNELNRTIDSTKENLANDIIPTGSIVKFGSYEQDGDNSNGKESIEWIILDTEGKRSILISRYVLTYQQYNRKYEEGLSWKNCSLRQWLNDSFLYEAFSESERNAISTATINNIKDKVFLLNLSEAEDYFPTPEDRKVTPTAYAQAVNKEVGGFRDSWWLRAPVKSVKTTQVLIPHVIFPAFSKGYIIDTDFGYQCTNYYGVRPVISIDQSTISTLVDSQD